MNKSILVTGSAGFIGFHVSQALLKKGYQVVGIDNLNDYYDPKLKFARNEILQKNENYIFLAGDVADAERLDKVFSLADFDTICHLAAQAGVRYSLEKPMLYGHSNISAFLQLLEAMRRHNKKHLVYASSSSVYGNVPVPADGFSEELNVSEPISLYAATKVSNELMAYTYHHLFKFQMTGLRFFTVYGPWGRPDMAYYSFSQAIQNGKEIQLYNEGNMWRDFTYIDDIVSGVIAAIESPLDYEVINLGNSQPENVRDFVGYLENYLGREAKIRYTAAPPGDMVKTFANVDKASKLLGFKPQTSLSEGLKKFVEWYKEYHA